MGLIQRLVRCNRTPTTHRPARHQLLRLMRCMQTYHPSLTGAGAGEIEDSAEMSIGVMVPSNRLIPVTDDRPAPLQMQGDLASGEPN